MNKEISERISTAFSHIDEARRILEAIPNGEEDVLLYDALRALEMPAGEDFQNSVKRRLYQYLNCGPVEQQEKPAPRTFVQPVWHAVEIIREENLSHADMLAVVQIVYDAGRDSMTVATTQEPNYSDAKISETTLNEISQKLAATAQAADRHFGQAAVDYAGRYEDPAGKYTVGIRTDRYALNRRSTHEDMIARDYGHAKGRPMNPPFRARGWGDVSAGEPATGIDHPDYREERR